MKCGFRKLSLVLLLLASFVFAQEDDLIDRYNLALENLSNSVRLLPSDPAQSREELDRAAQALRPLSRDSESERLLEGLEATFERARTTISNQSQTDLAIQAAVIEGGIQRLVYETALQAAGSGDLALASQRVLRIAQDMELPQATLDAFAEPLASVGELRTTLEQGVAERVSERLTQVGTLEDKGEAYQALAEAYGGFIPVQGSPRVDPATGRTFAAAIQALVDEEPTLLSEQLVNLTSQMEALSLRAQNTDLPLPAPELETRPDEAAAVSEASENAEQAPEVASEETTGVEATTTPAVAAESTEPTEAAPEVAPEGVNETPDSEAAEATAEVTANVEATTGDAGNAEAEALGTDASETAILSLEDLIEQQRLDAVEGLRSSLSGYGLNEAAQTRLAESYQDAGYANIQDALAPLYASSARATVAVETGDQDAARAHINDFSAHYEDYLAPLVQNPTFETRTAKLLRSLSSATALRLQDVVVLSGQVEALETVLEGGLSSSVHNGIVDTTNFWAGFPRLFVVIVLGLLAFVPLYLLNLAFGGGNRNWRLIGIALFLLLTPIIYEGLSFIGSLLASLSGIQAFNGLSTFSMFQNTISQVIWVAVTGLAILFAITGLYGICQQFGLIGEGKLDRTALDTGVRATSERAPETLVDWDEEF